MGPCTPCSAHAHPFVLARFGYASFMLSILCVCVCTLDSMIQNQKGIKISAYQLSQCVKVDLSGYQYIVERYQQKRTRMTKKRVLTLWLHYRSMKNFGYKKIVEQSKQSTTTEMQNPQIPHYLELEAS